MKNLLTFGLLAWVAISTSCKKGDALNPIKLTDQTGITIVHDSTYYVYPTGYSEKNAFLAPTDLGVPAYLEIKNDIISPELISYIDTLLPPKVSLPINHPQYIDPSASNTINITAATQIYLTFVTSGTGYKSTLAYYTYKTASPPTTNRGGSANGAMDKITYIFPNAIIKSNVGGLIPGNKVKLGSFEPGTSIGFVLIARSWTGTSINNEQVKYYNLDNLNPETVNRLKRHAILLYDNTDDLFLLGFEDINRQVPGCDNDFNDVVVSVSSSTPNSISKTNIAVINGN